MLAAKMEVGTLDCPPRALNSHGVIDSRSVPVALELQGIIAGLLSVENVQ